MELRWLVGPVDPSAFDNPTGAPILEDLEDETFQGVFDFGCGCGRLARKLIQQNVRPRRYLGIDLHEGMIEWCQNNLARRAPGFDFLHHDVFNPRLNPGSEKPRTLPLPGEDGGFSLVIAWSVFTHLIEEQAVFYLNECRRLLRPSGVLASTWFLFEKSHFPVLGDSNALYVDPEDVTSAVMFDREWLRRQAKEAGLSLLRVDKPQYRGFQWVILMTPTREGVKDAELPVDDAPLGSYAELMGGSSAQAD